MVVVKNGQKWRKSVERCGNCGLSVSGKLFLKGTQNQSETLKRCSLSDALERVVMTPKEAKTLVRVKRWGGFKTFTGEEEEEEEEGSRERQARENLRRCAHARAKTVVRADADS